MEKTPNPFPFKGWSHAAWQEGYVSANGVNPYLPENEMLGENWQDGYAARLHDVGESLGRTKTDQKKQEAYIDMLYFP